MRKISFKTLIATIALMSLMSCAHAISKEVRDKADKGIKLSALFKNPDAYKGKLVLLGGVIAGTKNAPEGTYIEVVQKPLDSYGMPLDTDSTRGRFIVLYDGYLDAVIYSQGREVAVAGEVLGKRSGRLGDIDYTYLFIKSAELHLFKLQREPVFRFGIGMGHSF